MTCRDGGIVPFGGVRHQPEELDRRAQVLADVEDEPCRSEPRSTGLGASVATRKE